MDIEKQIEAILFWKGEPVSRKKLAEILKVGQSEINESIEKIKESLKGRGTVLIEKENEIMLGTAPEFASLIEDLQKEELNKELSKASLETLSIVLYKNGVSRAEIDYIRGVNSSFTLRALSIRGLVEKTIDENDSRRYIYKPSFELLSYMGIKSVVELPDYGEVSSSIDIAAKNLEEELKKEEENKSEN
ncbi:MAG TPA: SMC-Scp complex subunit ScpB [Candidatus Paceibacterota bacterium]|nr:SMC-Scp complex subunit ScpB [Candidatus Paceibacterota bacterium]